MELKIEHLDVQLQNDEIIKDISIQINSGEFVSLLGASGCGKSTLLKSIAGLIEIEKGTIYLENREIQKLAPERRDTVIVFQDLRLFPHMTVRKNILFSMEIKKISKKIQQEVVSRLLEEVQLVGYENRKIREMSGGQLQRVALARALAAEPSVLLLDEPFSGLDEKLRLEMGVLVKKIQRERKITTILVTHDKKEALQMSERIALMDGGEIIQYDTPEKIFYEPCNRTVADYFGKANYIVGTIRNGVFASEVGALDGVGYPDGTYEVMIRPFSFELQIEGQDFVIKEITFMGETAEITLRKEEQEYLVSMLSHEFYQTGLVVGMKTGVKIKSERRRFIRRDMK